MAIADDHRVAPARWEVGGNGVEEGDGEIAADRADDHEHEDPDPDLVAGGEGPHVAHDELRSLRRGDRPGQRLGGRRNEASAAGGDDHGRGLRRVGGGHEGGVEVALADVVHRSGDRRHRR